MSFLPTALRRALALGQLTPCAGCRAPFLLSEMRRLPAIVVDRGVGVYSWRCRGCDDLWMLHAAWCEARGLACIWHEGIFRGGVPPGV